MNKSSTIQLVFVIIGIISFWQGLQYFLNNATYLFSFLFGSADSDYFWKTIFFTLFQSSVFFGLGYFLIIKSLEWSKWCAEKSEIDNDFKIVTSASNILYILFLMIGTYALIKSIPIFIEKIYLAFESKAGVSFLTERMEAPSKTSWLISFLNILVPLAIILLGRNIADYFSTKINGSDLIEIAENKDSSTDIL